MNDFNPQIVIDLDRTLLDTDSLYMAMYECCARYGVSQRQLQAQQECISKTTPFFCFQTMVQWHARSTNLNLTNLLEDLRNLLSEECDKYVFTDSYHFLRLCADHGWSKVLLTYGDQHFQEKKINGSKLSVGCNQAIVTQKPKWELPEIFSVPQTVFIDDNSDNIDMVKKTFPQVLTIAVKRVNTKYADNAADNADHLVHSLFEVECILCELHLSKNRTFRLDE